MNNSGRTYLLGMVTACMMLAAAPPRAPAQDIPVSDIEPQAPADTIATADTVDITALKAAQAAARASQACDSATALRRAYRFADAVQVCSEALEEDDSTYRTALEEELLLASNGLSMMDYCSRPTVVARHTFSLGDFFLFYPLPKESWHPVPNALDKGGPDGPSQALYAPPGTSEIYYSAPDGEGIRNIYRTVMQEDSLWTAPSLINEHTTSSSDEIYPMLSPDGKSLYFASKGLYGMGGYDLYVSTWNEAQQDWDIPTNLGLPYSSPYDDFLYINSADGRYTLFASNRECSPDSVTVYVLEYEVMPVRSAVRESDELRKLASLQPPKGRAAAKSNLASMSDPIKEDANTVLYMEKMTAVRQMRDSLKAADAELDALRARYQAQSGDRDALRAEILSKELALPALRGRVNQAAAELQKVELDFLMKGITIDPDAMRSAADKEVIGGIDGYLFYNTGMGPALDIRVQEPQAAFDYTFRVLETGAFAEDNTLPSGLVYQIQLFSSSGQATVEQLRGLSPVFERVSGGKFIYSAGVFRSYADALANLNTAKRAGFRGATVTAFRDGVQMGIREARDLESRIVPLYKIRLWPADGHAPSELALSAVRQQSDSDITRTMDGAAVVYEIGPMEDREQCAALCTLLAAAGEPNTAVVEAGLKIPE